MRRSIFRAVSENQEVSGLPSAGETDLKCLAEAEAGVTSTAEVGPVAKYFLNSGVEDEIANSVTRDADSDEKVKGFSKS